MERFGLAGAGGSVALAGSAVGLRSSVSLDAHRWWLRAICALLAGLFLVAQGPIVLMNIGQAAEREAALLRADAVQAQGAEAPAQAVPPTTTAPTGAEGLGSKVYFEANHGQAPRGVDFVTRGPGYTMSLAASGVTMALQGAGDEPGSLLGMQFVGSNPAPEVVGTQPGPMTVNYYIGNDPDAWVTGASTYAKVSYEGLYAGVDAVYRSRDGVLAYDFIVSPEGDPDAISFQMRGARDLEIARNGDLLVHTKAGTLRQKAPISYQVTDGTRSPVDSGFRLLKGHRVGFEVGAYDTTKTLVIDPSVIYSTFLGGSYEDVPRTLEVDSQGNAYLYGVTESSDFPTTPNAYQRFPQGCDEPAGADCQQGGDGGFDENFNFIPPTNSGEDDNAFVAKFDPFGDPIYVTYLGGESSDGPPGMPQRKVLGVDGSGNAIVVGSTSSVNDPATTDVDEGFPLLNAYDSDYGNGANSNEDEAFVTKFNATGGLVYSTYLGGEPDDDHDGGEGAFGVAVDSQGRAFVTGITESGVAECQDGQNNDGDGQADWPADPQCESPGDDSEAAACANGIDDDGTGGTDANDPDCASPTDDSEGAGNECSDGVDNDGDGATDFPGDNSCDDHDDPSETAQCSDTADNDGDGQIDAADPGCAGGPQDDNEASDAGPTACSDGTDNDGDGRTDTADPGCRSADDTSEGNAQAECSDQVDNDNDGRTDFGSAASNDPDCSSADDLTEHDPFPTTPGAQDRQLGGDGDAFVAAFNPNGTAIYVTYLGGEIECPNCQDSAADEIGRSIATDGNGRAFVLGKSETSDLIVAPGGTCNAFDCTNDGNNEAFAAGYDAAGARTYATYIGGTGEETPYHVEADSAGNAYYVGKTSSGDGACRNGLDDDSDGQVDTADSECQDAGDTQEGSGTTGIAVGFPTFHNPAAPNQLDTQCESEASGDEDDAEDGTGRGNEAWVTKLAVDGSAVFSTCLGGDDSDRGYAIATDGQGNTYVTGRTDSSEPVCADGIDNDGDGATDYPGDADCESPTDPDSTEYSECNNNLDDDGNDGNDGPNQEDLDETDPNCTGPTDQTEDAQACDDDQDNDGDGFIDVNGRQEPAATADPDCTSTEDNTEAPTECATAAEDDGGTDGGAFNTTPADPDCTSLEDQTEGDMACDNGVDDDADGGTDFPADPGCRSTEDNSEAQDEPTPDCSDGENNDEDNTTDFPRDPGCSSANDATEQSNYPLLNPVDNASETPVDGDRDEEPSDAFVTKLGPNGGGVYSTYLGGDGHDYGAWVSADGSGNAYVTGRTAITDQSDFPVTVDALPHHRGAGAYATKFDPNGAFIYSTYLDGAGGQEGHQIEFDSLGTAYVMGIHENDVEEFETPSPMNFPLENAYDGNDANVIDGTNAEDEAFLTRLGEFAACNDNVDNDGDGRIDTRDPGCDSPQDQSETDTQQSPPPTGGGTAPGPRLDISPESATNFLPDDKTHELTARTQNVQSGTNIDFKILAGPNATNPMTTTVDFTCAVQADGTCTVSYTGDATEGTDLICGYIDANNNNVYDPTGQDNDGGDCDTEGVNEFEGGDASDSVNKTWRTETQGPGDDMPRQCARAIENGADNVIVGTDDDDNLVGTPGPDIICAGGGDDEVSGLRGNDRIYLGPGEDVGRGQDGNDLIEGDVGEDALRGNRGNDILRGGLGNDDLNGGDGRDRLLGQSQNDLLIGRAGPDTLIGGTGNDKFRGNGGADNVTGGRGADRMQGDAGPDVLKGNGGNDFLSGGGGNDNLNGGAGLRDRCRGGRGTDTSTNCEL